MPVIPNPSGQAAANTRLFKGNGASPEVYTFIANVTNNELDFSTAFKDTTAHGSQAGSTAVTWKTQVPTIQSASAKLTLEWAPDNVTLSGIMADSLAHTLDAFVISYPDPLGTYFSFLAYVGKFGIKAPIAGTLTADVPLEVTGPVSGPFTGWAQ